MEYFVLIMSIVAVVVIAKILSWPFKKILNLVINALSGLAILYIANYYGADFGLNIPFNWVTAVISGILGIPGIIVLGIFYYVF